jgi:hypothetical protein
MTQNGVVAGGRLTDWVSLGVLAASVPQDAVDDAVAAAGRQARRSDGKLPPHVVVYLVMALALFADDDYEEVAARLTETLTAWGCWDDSWSVPTSGGITQARQRLGHEPLAGLFGEVAVPVAEELTAGAVVAGQGGPDAAGAGTAARRVLPISAGEPEDRRQGPPGTHRSSPGRGRPGRGHGPPCPGD